MQLTFIELPPFEQYRQKNLSDDDYLALQNELMTSPEKGDLIPSGHGLRKLRIADSLGNKGKQGGGRVIYYYACEGKQIWLFTAYKKGEQENLSEREKRTFSVILENLKALERKWRMQNGKTF